MKKIPLTKGYVTLVDDSDFDRLSRFKWHAIVGVNHVYGARKFVRPDGSRTARYIHQEVIPGVLSVDHRDGNSLNNRRRNLRPASKIENGQGFRAKPPGCLSRFRGVSWDKQSRRWFAQIKFKRVLKRLGYGTTEADAARLYDSAAKKFFKHFAQLNFP